MSVVGIQARHWVREVISLRARTMGEGGGQNATLAHLLIVPAARAVTAPARPPEQPMRQWRGSVGLARE